ncbi:ABC transporter substrate-binding protein [Branchiibius hedensis]|uniref:ABC transporter substrate-binding protein n=1 Tax=Branchiibius hedensis TaxID=672460 RepID=UPI001FE8F4A5|nr:ABC transporter substrate-binding protein [Branchiibius hedensis]
MTRRGVLGAVAAVTGAGALAACGSSSDSSGASGSGSAGTTAITVGVIPIVDVAPIYLGVKQGYFKAEGLEVKLQTAQGGAAIVPAVVSGQYQFGFSNSVSLILASSKGLKLKAVAEGVSTTGVSGKDFGAVVVKSGSSITNAKDLEGKKIGVNTLNNINTTTINKAVRDAGGDPSTIKYTELGFPDIVSAVKKGDIDAGQVVEPFLTTAESQGMTQVVSNYVATDPNLTVAMYFTSQQYAQQHADIVAKFTTAMNKSLEYANSNGDAVRDILSTYTDIDKAVLAKITLPKWPTEINDDSISLLADLAVTDKLITSKPDLSTLLPS